MFCNDFCVAASLFFFFFSFFFLFFHLFAHSQIERSLGVNVLQRNPSVQEQEGSISTRYILKGIVRDDIVDVVRFQVDFPLSRLCSPLTGHWPLVAARTTSHAQTNNFARCC